MVVFRSLFGWNSEGDGEMHFDNTLLNRNWLLSKDLNLINVC